MLPTRSASGHAVVAVDELQAAPTSLHTHPGGVRAARMASPLHDRTGSARAESSSLPLVAAGGEPPALGDTDPPTEAPQAKILYRSPGGVETDFVLLPDNSVGRHPKNNIILNDREISKRHARIYLRADEWWIEDLQSSNGTFVNKRRVRAARLDHLDWVQMGSVRLQFLVKGREDSIRDLVTILPQSTSSSTHIHAKLQQGRQDFRPAAEVTDLEELRRDYEKLRMSHELSRVGLTPDLNKLLPITLDMVFSMFPADNAVIMLVDEDTNTLVPHTVRQRDGHASSEGIVLSSTMVNGAIQERTSILASDAFLDPRFSASQSIIAQGIRAAMCVPLIAHDKVLGLLHVDSRERVGVFSEKDLQILQTIALQTASAIENARLLRQIEVDAQTRGQLGRFLPPHVVEEMIHKEGVITPGGREVTASVVFCDIRGFTRMAEDSGPTEVVELLNSYFERLVEVVFKRHGVLDKFIGDALMASWGTIDEDADLAVETFNCVAAAVEFRDTIRELNAERAEHELAPINMGVGVNTGHMVAGYMGSNRRRLEFTVIGDAVNTASRICGVAAADQVIISEETYRQVADRIEARYLERRKVKGREQGVDLYEVERILGEA